MNVVYTVNGEGMGHASRSSVIIDHLLAQGHQVTIFTAGATPLSFLKKKYTDVAEVMGFHMVYRENKVHRIRTAFKVLGDMPEIRKDIRTIKQVLAHTKPDLVVTDFDVHGQIVASLFKVPIISIDNIQLLHYTNVKTPTKDLIDYEINALVAKFMVPRADHYFITTFDPMMLRNEHREKNVTFVPPILRDKVLALRAIPGDHVLVYQTSDSYSDLIPILARTHEKYLVYNCKQQVKSDRIVYRTFDEDTFITDLAASKAVITNGGFTVITEALYFGKPVLSIPIANHFEQKLNAILLDQYQLGMSVPRISRIALKRFFEAIAHGAIKKSDIMFDNQILFSKLDAVVREAALP